LLGAFFLFYNFIARISRKLGSLPLPITCHFCYTALLDAKEEMKALLTGVWEHSVVWDISKVKKDLKQWIQTWRNPRAHTRTHTHTRTRTHAHR